MGGGLIYTLVVSPRYITILGRFWRKHLDTDFNLLVRLATEEILGLRGARR